MIKEIKYFILELLFCCGLCLPFYLMYKVHPSFLLAWMGGVITFGLDILLIQCFDYKKIKEN